MKEHDSTWLDILGGIILLVLTFIFATPLFWQSMFQLLQIIASIMIFTNSFILHFVVILLFTFSTIALYFSILYKSYLIGYNFSQKF